MLLQQIEISKPVPAFTLVIHHYIDARSVVQIMTVKLFHVRSAFCSGHRPTMHNDVPPDQQVPELSAYSLRHCDYWTCARVPSSWDFQKNLKNLYRMLLFLKINDMLGEVKIEYHEAAEFFIASLIFQFPKEEV